jgi:hypothetical protein
MAHNAGHFFDMGFSDVVSLIVWKLNCAVILAPNAAAIRNEDAQTVEARYCHEAELKRMSSCTKEVRSESLSVGI